MAARSRINGQKAEAQTLILSLEERMNNPQPSVIRGQSRGHATLFLFGVEDAAPHPQIAWSIIHSAQRNARGYSGSNVASLQKYLR